MAKAVTFLHVEDIRLGAPIQGFCALTDDWALRLAHAVPESFGRVVETAVSRSVDFVLISGEVFDATRASYSEHVQFFEGIGRLDEAGIPTLLNVGGRSARQTWRQDVDRLPRSVRLIDADDPGFSLFHPGEEGDRLAAEIDAWGRERLSSRRIEQAESDSEASSGFGGCIQGCAIDEIGERGCHLVAFEEGHAPQVEFVPTSSIVFGRFAVDVSVCQTLSDLVHHVATKMFHENAKTHCDEMIVQVDMTGETDLHRFLTKAEVVSDLRKQVNDAHPSLYCDVLRDRTCPKSVPSRSRVPFVEVLSGIADEQGSRDESMINYLQSEFVKRGISIPEALSKHVGPFNGAAKMRVLDLLDDDGE